MEPVPVHTTFEETYRQLLFIDNHFVAIINRRNIRRALFFLALTVVCVLLFFFTDSNLGAVGVFMLPFWWLGFGLYLLYLKRKTHKRQTVALKELAESSCRQNSAGITLSFTDQEVSITQAQRISTIKWGDFRAYLEEDDTIYLFQEHPYLAWSFSEREVGSFAVARLKETARQKLLVLK